MSDKLIIVNRLFNLLSAANLRSKKNKKANKSSFFRRNPAYFFLLCSLIIGLLVARSNGVIVGLAGYRLLDNFLHGRFVYVDDLVVTATMQRSGFGEHLLQATRQQTVDLNCEHFVLNTGLHMTLAQHFYFHQGLLACGIRYALASIGINNVHFFPLEGLIFGRKQWNERWTSASAAIRQLPLTAVEWACSDTPYFYGPGCIRSM